MGRGMRLNRSTEEPQNRAARQAAFWETLESVWDRNRRLSAADAQALADAALAEVRADRPDAAHAAGRSGR